MRSIRRLIPNLYLVLALVFIYMPIAILIVYSFNALPKSFIWGGFSIDNYKNLFTGSEGMGSLRRLRWQRSHPYARRLSPCCPLWASHI